MKKLCVFVVILLCFCVLQTQAISFVSSLKPFNFGEYSVFFEEKLTSTYQGNCVKNGDIFIYNFGDKNDFEECVNASDFLCVQLKSNDGYEMLNYIKNIDAKKVKTESVCGIKIDYYFCEKLSKKTVVNNCVFNIVLATQSDGIIMGYPAIMGSL